MLTLEIDILMASGVRHAVHELGTNFCRRGELTVEIGFKKVQNEKELRV